MSSLPVVHRDKQVMIAVIRWFDFLLITKALLSLDTLLPNGALIPKSLNIIAKPQPKWGVLIVKYAYTIDLLLLSLWHILKYSQTGLFYLQMCISSLTTFVHKKWIEVCKAVFKLMSRLALGQYTMALFVLQVPSIDWQHRYSFSVGHCWYFKKWKTSIFRRSADLDVLLIYSDSTLLFEIWMCISDEKIGTTLRLAKKGQLLSAPLFALKILHQGVVNSPSSSRTEA